MNSRSIDKIGTCERCLSSPKPLHNCVWLPKHTFLCLKCMDEWGIFYREIRDDKNLDVISEFKNFVYGKKHTRRFMFR